MPGPARPRFDVLRSLPRMSWRPLNLYILWRRSLGPVAAEVTFKRSSKTLFQQRWISKRLVRGYHGDHIPEKVFKRWFLPRRLPDVRPHKTDAGKKAEQQYLQDKFTGRGEEAKSSIRKQEEASALAAQTPLTSLMFMELERRLDTFIFRCCFAPSVYQARQLIIHRNVHVNGVLQTNSNFRLSPGDMITVDPEAMTLLKQSAIIPTEELEAVKLSDEDPSADTAHAKDASAAEASSSQASATDAPSEAETSSTASESAETPSTSATKSERPKSSKPSKPPRFEFPAYASPFIFLPAYIEANPATCSAIYVRHPTARPGYSEIPSPYDANGEVMRFAWEWYAKNRSRSREKRPGGGPTRWTDPQETRH